MSAKPLTFALVAALSVVAVRGLSNAAERRAPAKPAAAAAKARHSAPARAATPARPAFDAAKAFVDLGCVGCHGDEGIYRDEIKGAIGKPVDQVGRWIRNAPSIKPNTDMPNFENVIDQPNSEALAAWVLNLAARRE